MNAACSKGVECSRKLIISMKAPTITEISDEKILKLTVGDVALSGVKAKDKSKQRPVERLRNLSERDHRNVSSFVTPLTCDVPQGFIISLKCLMSSKMKPFLQSFFLVLQSQSHFYCLQVYKPAARKLGAMFHNDLLMSQTSYNSFSLCLINWGASQKIRSFLCWPDLMKVPYGLVLSGLGEII